MIFQSVASAATLVQAYDKRTDPRPAESPRERMHCLPAPVDKHVLWRARPRRAPNAPPAARLVALRQRWRNSRIIPCGLGTVCQSGSDPASRITGRPTMTSASALCELPLGRLAVLRRQHGSRYFDRL